MGTRIFELQPLEARLFLSASATFVRSDAAAKGNWGAIYGSDGYNIFGGPTSLPSYAQVSAANQQQYVWASNTTDVRAPEDAPWYGSSGSVGRTASCDFSTTNFSLDVNLTDGDTHEVALYLLDWDPFGRSETVQVSDTATGTVLDTQSVSDFSNGKYLVWNISGDATITISEVAGQNAVASGLFFAPPATAPSGPAAATFVKSDVTTVGNWGGVYGAQGYTLLDSTSSVPSYAQLTATGERGYVWDPAASDVRAPQDSASSASRTASCYYSGSSFGLDLNLSFNDGTAHQVALYLIDWDTTSRAETVQVSDAYTGNSLDTQTVSNFNGGTYLVWNLHGDVRITLTCDSGLNAVASGIFFDAAQNTSPAPANLAATGTTPTSVSLSWDPFAGATGYSILRQDPGQASFAPLGSATGTSFTDASASPDTAYSYEVTATTSNGSTPPSDPVSVLTLADPNANDELWPAAPTPQMPDDYSSQGLGGLELGTQFTSDVAGFVTGMQFYKSALNTGPHVGHLWDSAGALLATGTFTGESQSGWQQLDFSNPVAVTAGQTYTISYFEASGHYPLDQEYFATPTDNAPLHAPAGSNGVYSFGPSARPTYNYNSSNYWVQPVFVTAATPAPPTNVTASGNGSTSIIVNWTPGPDPSETYSVYLSTAPGFSPSPTTLIVSGLPSTPSQYQIDGLDRNATYYIIVTGSLPTSVSPPAPAPANNGNPTVIGSGPSDGSDGSPPREFGTASSGSVAPNDDLSGSLINLGFKINFYGGTYTQAYVNNNGNITFKNQLSQYTPQDITGLSYPMIAPFWADVDTRTQIDPATGDSGCGTVTFLGTTVNGRPAFEADWTGVGYFNLHSDLKNTFSVQIVNRDDVNIGDFDIIFHYGSITWETGDASGGRNGMGGTPAYAGWTNGDQQTGDSFQLPGSGQSGGLIGMSGQKFYPIRNADLAIDTDNNDGFHAPDRSYAEEVAQNDPSQPGKTLIVNNNDANKNGIPDWADGYGLTGVNDTAGTDGNHFVPVTVRLSNDVKLSSASVTFNYDSSDPLAVTYDANSGIYTLPSGSLRLWKKDGTDARNGDSVDEGGDFIDSGIAYDASQLGFTSIDDTITLYLEALAPSSADGDAQVSMTVKSTDSSASTSQSDTIGATAIQFDYVGAQLDENYNAGSSSADLTFDREISGPIPITDSQRLERYYDWSTRSADTSGATTSSDDGITGLITSDSDIEQAVNFNRLLFKIHASGPSDVVGDSLQFHTFDSSGNDQSQTSLSLEPDPSGNGFITTDPVLLYQDDGGRPDTSAVESILPAGTVLLDPARIGITVPTVNDPVFQNLQNFNLYNGQGATIYEFNPSKDPASVTVNAAAGAQIIMPNDDSTADDSLFYSINADDSMTGDVILEAHYLADGSPVSGQLLPPGPPNVHFAYQWFLNFQFKAGDTSLHNGTGTFNINQWHELNGGEFLDLNDFAVGARLPIGDYQVFFRAAGSANGKDYVGESNMVAFSVLGTNPGKDRIVARVDTYTNPAGYNDLTAWYKAILAQESGAGGYTNHHAWDQFENNPETNGTGVGFGRTASGNTLTWNARYGFPFVSYDNGWGIAQLTGPQYTITDISRWTSNVDAGWKILITDKLAAAQADLAGHPATAEQVVMEAVARYNGGTYFTWDDGHGQWVADANPKDYVNLVAQKKLDNGF